MPVTPWTLGNPLLVGAEQVRELSDFRFEVDLRRRTVSTLAKSLLPVGLMTLMMFASLWFPPALARDKVAVAITGALSATRAGRDAGQDRRQLQRRRRDNLPTSPVTR